MNASPREPYRTLIFKPVGQRVRVSQPDWAVYLVDKDSVFDIRGERQSIEAIRFLYQIMRATSEDAACETAKVLRHLEEIGACESSEPTHRELHTIFGEPSSPAGRLYKAIVRTEQGKCWLELD